MSMCLRQKDALLSARIAICREQRLVAKVAAFTLR